MTSPTTDAARTQLDAASADPMSAELTVPATTLARLVTVCLPHTDRLLPIFRCVRLFEQGGSLWAEATDRYTAIRARSDIKAPEGFTALIDRDDCRAIVAGFKPARGSTVNLALTVTDDRLTVSVAEGMVKVGLDLTLTVQCQQGAYPPVLAHLYTQLAQREVVAWLPTINAAYLRRLPDEPAQIRYSAQHKSIGFYANPDDGESDWAAIIMPLRGASSDDLVQAWDTETTAAVAA